jgi:hypothetical protein
MLVSTRLTLPRSSLAEQSPEREEENNTKKMIELFQTVIIMILVTKKSQWFRLVRVGLESGVREDVISLHSHVAVFPSGINLFG